MYEQIILTAYKSGEPNYGYNISPIAGSRRGVKHSEAVKQKMRQAAANRKPISDETRARLSEAMKNAIKEGRTFTAEHRRKISESQIGKFVSPETRKKIGDSGRGRSPSEETRRKLSDATKGKPLTPENYQRLLERTRIREAKRRQSS